MISSEDFKRLFDYLNEADANADELYEVAVRAGAKGSVLNHPAHRIAGSLLCVRHILERADGRPINSTHPPKK